MQIYLIYIIPALVVAVIFVAGFAYSRKAMKNAQPPGAFAQTDENADERQEKPGSDIPKIYEAPGVNQQSGHPLGAVQSVIRGRIRFAGIGLMIIGVALFGLYAVHIGDFGANVMDSFGGRTPINVLAVSVIMAGAILWGLRLMSYATCRVKLRRTGFEISSVLGKKAHAYKDVDFYLSETIEHKYASEGYRPMVMKSQNFNWIWVCQVLFHDGRKPIVLKSSRYAWLKTKITALTEYMEKSQ
jgi:hypothetical protein